MHTILHYSTLLFKKQSPFQFVITLIPSNILFANHFVLGALKFLHHLLVYPPECYQWFIIGASISFGHDYTSTFDIILENVYKSVNRSNVGVNQSKGILERIGVMMTRIPKVRNQVKAR